MFRHSLLITFRNFKKYKSSFFINLIGLSTGLACALLIYLWVNDELAYDKFHENDSRLYRVMELFDNSGGIELEEGTSGLLADALAEEMPEVEYAVTAVNYSAHKNLTVSAEGKDFRAEGKYVGKDYFNIFSFPFIHGNKDQVLEDKHSIVLSEGLAIKLFGTTDGIIGKAVKFQHEKEYFVSGIFYNIPPNSSQQLDFALSFEDFRQFNTWIDDWDSSSPDTYVVLKEGADPEEFKLKIRGFMSTKGDFPYRSLFISPFSDYYLYGRYENGKQAGGRITYVKLFSVVAVFILLIACINFMNLSTAKASGRLKEVGIKKTVGAGRGILIAQYLGESVMMAALSLLVAVVLIFILLPWFNELTGKQLLLNFELTPVLWALAVTIFTGLISGSYPALYLSGFNPAGILKGGSSFLKFKTKGGELWLRKGLVVFQFTLSVILIVAVLVVYRQFEYIQNKNLGYNKENIIHFKREGALGDKLQAFLSEIKAIPGIINASTINANIIDHDYSTSSLEWKGKGPDDRIDFEVVVGDYKLMQTLGIEMSEGRYYSEAYGKDSSGIILNEAATKVMGLKEPLGKIVKLWGEDLHIIGVTKNFHFRSLHEEVKPALFRLNPKGAGRIMVKTEAGKEQEAIAGLQELYSEFNPGFPFDFQFLDDDYQAQYIAEQRVSVLSRYFAGIAILISCLGLYGLVSFSAEQRRKEIGIRKVLGASVANIMKLLSKDFLKLVVLAILTGSLLSWLAMNKWLEGFAYRIELGWWVFGAAGAAALFIALATVSFQAMKAARANPVNNLRTE